MRVRENLGSVVSSVGRNNFAPLRLPQVGKVYGVVTTKDTPTPEMFNKVGGFSGIGSIFYLNYEQSKFITGSVTDDFLDKCDIAKPFYPQFQYYPALKELVYIIDKLPSSAAQISDVYGQTYYISTINLWNNQQQNSQPTGKDDSLGSTLYENPNVRPLIAYQGDNIIQGRQGISLRFSTTTRGIEPSNEWSEVGTEIDPITILTNGLAYDPSKQYYVEQINKDASSIYLTSTQKLPLQTNKTGVLNNLTNPLNASDYFNSQVILNADRVTLNSKKDEVMIFATTNVEINTKNVINLNADERVHLNSNSIFLGPYDKTKTFPLQPVLLGYETTNLFEHLQSMLTKLAIYLSSAVGVPEGAPMLGINAAGKELIRDTQKMCDLIEKILSQKVYTS
jgi:hypothetical protein